jgi:hypothetical protein
MLVTVVENHPFLSSRPYKPSNQFYSLENSSDVNAVTWPEAISRDSRCGVGELPEQRNVTKELKKTVMNYLPLPEIRLQACTAVSGKADKSNTILTYCDSQPEVLMEYSQLWCDGIRGWLDYHKGSHTFQPSLLHMYE